MRSRIDLTGKRFGLYTAVSYAGNSKWSCICDCGNVREVFTRNLTKGQSNSCGCQVSSLSRKKAFRHGMADTPIHRAWMSMRQRCNNSNDRAYKNYGGRGIQICERWNLFEKFMEDMGDLPDGYELDRIDVNGNYEPSNCRWATITEQNRNKRNSRLLNYKGVIKTLAEWSELFEVSKSALQKRLALGWSVESALTTPVRPMRRSEF